MQQAFPGSGQIPTGGGNAAGEQLYHVHARALFAYIRLHLPEQEEAEDLLFEVFLTAWEQRSLVGNMNEAAQRTWLRSVAHHKIIDRYRRSQRRPVVALDAIAETLYEDERHSPEQIALRHEEFARIHAILANLPELQRQVVQLRFIYGLRSTEIAETVGKNEGTVRKLLWRALKLVRALYTQEQGGTYR